MGVLNERIESFGASEKCVEWGINIKNKNSIPNYEVKDEPTGMLMEFVSRSEGEKERGRSEGRD
jgi:hypothetical protein